MYVLFLHPNILVQVSMVEGSSWSPKGAFFIFPSVQASQNVRVLESVSIPWSCPHLTMCSILPTEMCPIHRWQRFTSMVACAASFWSFGVTLAWYMYVGHFGDSQPGWCFCLFRHSMHWSVLEMRWIDWQMQVSSWRWVRCETLGLGEHLTTQFRRFDQTHGIGVELCRFWWNVLRNCLWESPDMEDGVVDMSGTRTDVGPCVMMHWNC